MVVAQDRRGSVLCGVIGWQSQLRLGQCCTCTVSCEAHPPLLWVVPAMGLPVTCNSDHGLQQIKIFSIIFSTPDLFRPGHSLILQWTPLTFAADWSCPLAKVPLRCSCFGMARVFHPWVPSEVYLLCHGLIYTTDAMRPTCSGVDLL